MLTINKATFYLIDKSHTDFRTQCIIMTFAGGKGGGGGGGGAIANDVLKFRKAIKFESSCIILRKYMHIYKIIQKLKLEHVF